ncbi:MAG TPA: hypothetical protein VJ326_08135 [Thermoplasmata archaeon]|nr:hypothetical protein [Thermoplasmata archaeon]
MPSQVAPKKFKAYTGLGSLFTTILSIPGAAFAFLLFGTLLPPFGNAVAASVGLVFFAVWVLAVGRAFVPVYLEPTGSGLITHFFRLHRVVFSPWSEVKLYRIAGAMFAVGSVKTLPISLVVVRRHTDFLREVSGHLMSLGQHG